MCVVCYSGTGPSGGDPPCTNIYYLPLLPAVPVVFTAVSSPAHHNLTSNVPVTLRVDFTGRQDHNLTITWHRNNFILSSSSSRIVTTFDPSASTGRTELHLPQVTRAQAGLYRVVVSNSVGGDRETPIYSSQQEKTYQIDITGK